MAPTTRTRPRPILAAAVILVTLLVPPLAAQEDEDDGIRQRVARVASLSGDASLNRGDDPDTWQPVSPNYPLSVGDRVWTARESRMVLETDGATLFLSSESELAFLELVDGRTQLALNIGTASFRVHEMGRDEVFEVATPNASLGIDRPGWYRVDVDPDGNCRAVVFQGRAFAAAGGGQVELFKGDAIRVDGLDRPRYDVFDAPRQDAFDRWVDNLMREQRDVQAASYVSPDVYGAADLDRYGSWEDVPDYGPVWTPTVSVGWQPYRDGRWVWRDPWGWTWVAGEPWGWAPYHWGRWVVVRDRWCWVPGGPRAPRSRWSPALVAFVGSPDLSIRVTTGGFVGWFPLGPRDPFPRWWGPRPYTPPPHVEWRNRGFVTVVKRDVFVSGRRVERSYERDTRVIREVSGRPVFGGPVPVVPTRDSIRIRGEGRLAVPVPREGGSTRPVVTRYTPPPPPPRFDRKVEVIRERGGAPVAPDVAVRMAPDRPVERTRPVSREGTGVVLTPARPEAAERQAPVPVRPGEQTTGRGRERTEPSRAPERRDAPEPRGTYSGHPETGRGPTPAPYQARPQATPAPFRGDETRIQRTPPPSSGEERRTERTPVPSWGDERRTGRTPPPSWGGETRTQRTPPPSFGEERRTEPQAPRPERTQPPPVPRDARPQDRREILEQQGMSERRDAPQPRVERTAPPPPREERKMEAPAPRVERAAPPPPREERKVEAPPPRVERVAPPPPPRVEKPAEKPPEKKSEPVEKKEKPKKDRER